VEPVDNLDRLREVLVGEIPDPGGAVTRNGLLGCRLGEGGGGLGIGEERAKPVRAAAHPMTVAVAPEPQQGIAGTWLVRQAGHRK
jgi:hypothetical protein